MDKKETNAEEARQNWHIIEMQCTWKARRALAKKNATNAIAKAKAEKEEKIKYIHDLYDALEAKIMETLNDELLTIARDQDEYMHRYRNYVASLPKDEQAAYDMHRE
jgi:uncharacterized damage-inducible protein DinB